MERHLERPRRAAACAAMLALSLSLGAAGAAYGNESASSGATPHQSDAILTDDAALLGDSETQEDESAPAPDAPSADESAPETDAPAEEPPADTDPPAGAADDETAGKTPGENGEGSGVESEEGTDPADSGHDGTQVGDGAQPSDDVEVPDSPDSEEGDGDADDLTGSESPVESEDGASAPSDTSPSAENPTETSDTPAEGTAADSLIDATVPPATEESADTLESSGVENLIATLAITDGWSREGGTWYHYTDGKPDTGWLVTGTAPGSSSSGALQRYWLDPATGELATSRLISASEAGWWAYATPSGAVVRGKWTDSSTGYVYLADNDGRLESPGWLVTGAYTGGDLQRYWIDSKTHACIPGYSSEGWAHYTTSSGCVLRGSLSTSDGVLLADNDGKLASGSGWLVTGAYTGGDLQRYWLESRSGYSVAKTGLFSVGNDYYYGLSTGYVVRGRWTNSSTGYIYLADNDGKLIGGKSGGWVVTGYFTGGDLQRYWIDPTAHAAIPGYSTAGWAHYTTSSGYVLRGKLASGNHVLLADNDGKLASGTGWLITAAYDGGVHLQRYWLESLGNGYYGARTGLFQVSGSSYYGTSNGYVLRNAVQQIGGTWYRADNDGKLTAGSGSSMWVRAQQYASATNYLLLIDSSSHTVGVFQGTGKAYEWNQLSAWPCGNGAWSTPTVKGVFTVQDRGYSFGSGYTCYYWTQFYGDYLFHSILYWPGTFIVQDGTLGASVSHGCVRLSLENAKWIYDNIPRGTTVVSY